MNWLLMLYLIVLAASVWLVVDAYRVHLATPDMVPMSEYRRNENQAIIAVTLFMGYVMVGLFWFFQYRHPY